MEIKEEIIIILHYLMQQFVLNEIQRMNKEKEKEMKLIQTIGDCMNEINENNPLSFDVLNDCNITPELFEHQIIQSLSLSSMTNRIDFN